MGNRNIITLDKTYEAKIETVDEFEESIFKDVYNKASLMICEIINKNEMIEKRKWDSIKERNGLSNICNVIALMGERGSGKSSALASYQRFLTNFSLKDKNDYEHLSGNNKKLVDMGVEKRISFITLDIMDTTLLDSKENIIEIILARMLEKLEEQERKIRSHDMKLGKYDISQLKSKIGNIYEVMHNKPKEDSWEVEPAVVTLKALSKSWNLRKEFQLLVEEYVGYFGNYGQINEKILDYYLVISIDDIDVNIMKCYEMLEMIRKYLMVPKVITIITANYESLTAVCKKYYYNQLRTDHQCSYNSLIDIKEIENLTNEYLEKVVPTGRKIYMPDLYYTEGFLEKNLYVKELNNIHFKEDAELSMRELVAGLLRLYTGVVCITGDYGNQVLYPTSIRKLCNYIKEFRQLEMVSDENPLETHGNNMSWLYADIMNRFLYQNIPDSDIVVIKEFNEMAADGKIAFLADKAIEKIKGWKKEENGQRAGDGNEKWLKELEEIRDNSKSDITYCIKLVEILKKLQLYSRQMLDCISVYFSMMMTRYCLEIDVNRGNRSRVFLSYWPKGCWSKWEDKKYSDNDIILSEAYRVPIYKIDMKDKSDDWIIEEIKKGILEYQLTRLFLLNVEGRVEQPSSLVDNPLDGEINFGLDRRKCWKINWLNFIHCIFNFEMFLEETKHEIIEQLQGQYDIKMEYFTLKDNMYEWVEEKNVRDVIPFYSTEWMMKIFNTISKHSIENMDASEIVDLIFGIIEKQLEELSESLNVKDKLEESEKWFSFCVHNFKDTFSECPIVKYFRNEESEYVEVRQNVFKNLDSIIKIIEANSRCEADETEEP